MRGKNRFAAAPCLFLHARVLTRLWSNQKNMLAGAIKPTRRAVLSLYARIFRLHRAKLPIEMKKLGDSYVRCVRGPGCALLP